MENAKKIKAVLGLLAGILVFEIIMLLVILRPLSFYVGMTLGVIFVVSVYVIAICWQLLKLLEKHKKQ